MKLNSLHYFTCVFFIYKLLCCYFFIHCMLTISKVCINYYYNKQVSHHCCSLSEDVVRDMFNAVHYFKYLILSCHTLKCITTCVLYYYYFMSEMSFVLRQSTYLLCSSPTNDRLPNSQCFRMWTVQTKAMQNHESHQSTLWPPGEFEQHTRMWNFPLKLLTRHPWPLVSWETEYKHWPMMWVERGIGTDWSPSLCLHSLALTSAASRGLGGSTLAIQESPVYLPGRITVQLYYILSKQEIRGGWCRARESLHQKERGGGGQAEWQYSKEG